MGLFYFGLVKTTREDLIRQSIHNEESMVLCELFVNPALVVDGTVGQSVTQIVPDYLLYGGIRVETEAQNVV